MNTAENFFRIGDRVRICADQNPNSGLPIVYHSGDVGVVTSHMEYEQSFSITHNRVGTSRVLLDSGSAVFIPDESLELE